MAPHAEALFEAPLASRNQATPKKIELVFNGPTCIYFRGPIYLSQMDKNQSLASPFCGLELAYDPKTYLSQIKIVFISALKSAEQALEYYKEHPNMVPQELLINMGLVEPFEPLKSGPGSISEAAAAAASSASTDTQYCLSLYTPFFTKKEISGLLSLLGSNFEPDQTHLLKPFPNKFKYRELSEEEKLLEEGLNDHPIGKMPIETLNLCFEVWLSMLKETLKTPTAGYAKNTCPAWYLLLQHCRDLGDYEKVLTLLNMLPEYSIFYDKTMFDAAKKHYAEILLARQAEAAALSTSNHATEPTKDPKAEVGSGKTPVDEKPVDEKKEAEDFKLAGIDLEEQARMLKFFNLQKTRSSGIAQPSALPGRLQRSLSFNNLENFLPALNISPNNSPGIESEHWLFDSP